MKTMISVAAVYLAITASLTWSAEKPNVLIIYTDDQGFGDASHLNEQAKFQTPNIDRIAAEGISFTNGHCSDTVCTPSRYGLLTGRYSWRTHLKRGVMGAEGKCLISDDRLTLASMLRDAGYRTSMVGKWHLGMDFPGTAGDRDWSQPVQDMPLDKGFDDFFGIPASLNYGVLAWFRGRHAAVPPTVYTAKKPNRRHVDYRIKPPYQDSPEATRKAIGKRGMEVAPDFIDNQCLTRFTDEAMAWIDRHQQSDESDKPFFLYLPLTSPHYPVCPLPEFWGQGECGGYGEFMIETDHHVGRLLDHLDQHQLAENTIVVFTSDNGPEKSWQQRINDFDHRSNGPWRGGKRDIYEGGHRVPFLVRWPAGIDSPGRRDDSLVGQIDLVATIAEIVDADLPDNAAEDSHSFAAVLKNPDAVIQRPPMIHHSSAGRFAINDDGWKLVMPHRNSGLELYHLPSDPSESTSVAGQNPEVVKRLTEAITTIVTSGRTGDGPAAANDTGHWDDLTWISADQYDALSAQ
ncbi:Arylsulfatase precursor [Crateriforma conspicua]|uniref:Arylsulfatase n=2 Tax=Planctomycetaceae TaxID=126 RepID=A0A5C6G0X1_9PLAN|nr:arylsulfatase [Crateriforma conspicua]TWU67535.1 Arylsulfatase precursor [Crateriforma conspicua]